MFLRLFLYILGVFITSYSFMFLLIYTSVLSNDVSFFARIFYLLSKFETYLLPLGLSIIVLTTFFDYKWYKLNRLRKQNRKATKKHYKEIIKNDKWKVNKIKKCVNILMVINYVKSFYFSFMFIL